MHLISNLSIMSHFIEIFLILFSFMSNIISHHHLTEKQFFSSNFLVLPIHIFYHFITASHFVCIYFNIFGNLFFNIFKLICMMWQSSSYVFHILTLHNILFSSGNHPLLFWKPPSSDDYVFLFSRWRNNVLKKF